MAAAKPIKVDSAGQLANFQTGDFVDVPSGGTGATTAAGARTALGLAIGTDVQAYSADTASLVSFNTTVGIPVRISTNTFAMRNIAVASTARLTITNPAGTAGDPTLDLATVTNPGNGGSLVKVTTDTYGRVSNSIAVVAGDLTPLLNATYAPIASPTFTGTVTLPTSTPSAALEAASKGYVDAMVAGQRVKDSVRVATTTSGTMATSFENADVVDGITLATGDRILIKDQAANTNGVYIVQASGTPVRATDFDGNTSTGEVVGGATFWVNEGTVNADTAWTLTNDGAITVGTTTMTFTQSSGLGQVTAGSGLTKTGNQLDVGTASSGRIVVNADNIDLASGIVTPGTYTKITVDTYGRATLGATATPADIGAQTADATLTALAALTGTGFVMMTATDTPVMRTLVSGGTITVTNPAGVAGNPSIDLTSGIATPGTYQSVTVDTYGRVTSGTTASSSVLTDNFTNGEAGTIVIGRAVYGHTTTDQVKLANANSGTTAQVIGLVAAASISTAASGSIAFSGIMAATTGQWDVVTGQTGGLTPGSMYFVSNTTAGALTTTAPSTGYIAAVGRALSTTKMALRFDPTIQL